MKLGSLTLASLLQDAPSRHHSRHLDRTIARRTCSGSLICLHPRLEKISCGVTRQVAGLDEPTWKPPGTAVKIPSTFLIAMLGCIPGVALEPHSILDQTVDLRPEVLELALEAYEQAEADDVVRRSVLTIIDYEISSYRERLWVIDMDRGMLLYREWVAYGMGSPRGSGGTMEEALSFSNEPGTLKSSLGLFLTAETYHGRHGYSLKLNGLEEGVNDNARERLIVLHGAEYVSQDRAEDRLVGRSWGCPAVRPEISKELIDTIKEGSILWIYYPHEEWLAESEFLDEK